MLLFISRGVKHMPSKRHFNFSVQPVMRSRWTIDAVAIFSVEQCRIETVMMNLEVE